VKDFKTVDMLVFRGEQELEETLKLWKTKSHVLRIIAPTEELEGHKDAIPTRYEITSFHILIYKTILGTKVIGKISSRN
jgi:hypothetical protein